jgi:undecaprenyl-phosphate 4-deoxy-4-formamido-L-arabinose transferase
MNNVEISVVVPVYNEAASLSSLFTRLKQSMDKIDKSYELIFVNDFSSDGSSAELANFQSTGEVLNVKVLSLKINTGQHAAIVEGMKESAGNVVITIDADMQTPPEEIYKIVEEMEKGFDYVGSYRDDRKDNWIKALLSNIANWGRENVLGIRGMKDHGCMLRGFRKSLVSKITKKYNDYSFVPILAYSLCEKYSEVEMKHNKGEFGRSGHSCYKLLMTTLNLLCTSSHSIRIISLLGVILVSVFSVSSVVALLGGIMFIWPLTAFVHSIYLLLVSTLILSIGIVGEHISIKK